tara:strand:+ start:78 stop:482 length:405 start_codon:yes stop_codon:yes gene_type:complete
MKYRIYQVSFTEAEYDHIDEVGRYNYPKKVFSMDLPVSKKITDLAKKGLDLGYYKHVSTIKTPLSLTLEEEELEEELEGVYKIGNKGMIDVDVEPYITRYLPMHSISVGDIIETNDGDGSHKYVVSRFGFEKIN